MTFRERNKRIKAMRRRGYTLKQIAAKYGISHQRAGQIILYVPVTPTYIETICEACGVKFNFKGRRKIYCSICRRRIQVMQGKDRARELTRIRDKNTCQECKRKWKLPQRRFDVHHLNGLCGKKSRDFDSIYEIGGLITYCHKCHMSKHVKLMGRVKVVDADRIKAVILLSKRGFSDNQIGKMFHTSATSVWHWRHLDTKNRFS